jgi:hypothetical protein
MDMLTVSVDEEEKTELKRVIPVTAGNPGGEVADAQAV